jgi:hypothetical protein
MSSSLPNHVPCEKAEPALATRVPRIVTAQYTCTTTRFGDRAETHDFEAIRAWRRGESVIDVGRQ